MYRSSSIARRGAPWLIGVGVLQVALGVFFVIGLGGIPYAGGGMVFTDAILLLVGIGLIVGGIVWLRRAADTDRISDTGLTGVGQVTAITQTGTMINHQPVIVIDMLVTVQGRAPYAARVKEPVPLILLNRLGGSLPVRVDPARPDRVVIQWDRLNDPTAYAAPGAPMASMPMAGMPMAGAMPMAPGMPNAGGMETVRGVPAVGGVPVQAIAGGPGGPGSDVDETLAQVAAAMAGSGSTVAPVYGTPGQGGISVEQLRAYVRANGISGMARIDQLADGGSTIGDERLFTMTTTVFLPERIPFTSGPSAAMVPLEKVPKIAVGVELPVKVAPENDHLVMFEWEKV